MRCPLFLYLYKKQTAPRTMQGEEDDAEQADWYRAMFTACRKRDWVKGFGIWDWPGNLEGLSPYAVCGRPAENVIAEEYGRKE